MMRVYSLPTHSRLRRATMLGGAWPRLSRASGAAGEVSSNSKASCEVTGISTWEGGHPDQSSITLTDDCATLCAMRRRRRVPRLRYLCQPRVALAPPLRDLGGRGDPGAAPGGVVE